MRRGSKESVTFWRGFAAALLLFALMAGAFTLLARSAAQGTSRQEAALLRESVGRAVTACYAIEGRYPASLEYLKENYGIYYDAEKYVVDLEVLGSNIRPQIIVLQRGEAVW